MIHISLSSVVAAAKELATYGSLAKLAIGAFAHKLWSKLVGAEKKAAAEVAKLEAEIKSKL